MKASRSTLVSGPGRRDVDQNCQSRSWMIHLEVDVVALQRYDDNEMVNSKSEAGTTTNSAEEHCNVPVESMREGFEITHPHLLPPQY